MFHIAIINESTVYTFPDGLLAALQTQVTRDFAPEWGVDAVLRLIDKPADALPDEWILAVLDDADQAGALGYHDLTADGQPLGKVFARTTQSVGLNVTVTISHELLEMLGDPDCNLSVEFDNAAGQPSKMYCREICDAPEDDSFAYVIDGISVSDFVRRAWFMPGVKGPYDYQNKITAPLQLLSGGYIGEMDIASTAGWTQVDAEKIPAVPNIRSLGRLEKRNKERKSWKLSNHDER